MKSLHLLALAVIASTGISTAGPLAPAPVDPYTAAPANAGWYFGLNGGFLWMDDVDVGNVNLDFDTGWGAMGAMGYQFGNGFGLGLGAGYLRGEFESVSGYGHQLGVSADLHMVPLTVNGSYTLSLTDSLGLYFGGGLGAAWNELNADSIEGVGVNAKASDWGFAWQARAGLGYEVSPGLVLNLGYRFINVAEGAGDSQDVTGHMAEAGFKVRF